jgi:hypothetical protein
MIQIFYDGKWQIFYPLSDLSIYPGDDYDNRQLKQLPDLVYGKMLNDVCESNPVYTYLNVDKNKLREVDTCSNYPLYSSKYF